jgi:photosystem II stability/assembly factor-like uncharacterized protein
MSSWAEEEKEADGPLSSSSFTGLEFRGIGPAVTSGRISDVAVDPDHQQTWYVAVSSGGVWKTENAGTTFQPVFDGEGSYSIGCVTIDPSDSAVIWVGTGENNNQRSVGYGDGVYKSVDGGHNWKRMGLESSEHIARILVDPRDSDVVYVAAQGPLWSAGGDRGIYKTADGGETWKQLLGISEHTGATDLWFDPRDPDILYAAMHQRRRRVWTYVGGGPESGIHKSTDAGATWRKLENGLPKGDKGRIGLAVSPVNPDVVYALVEAAEEAGFYRSVDAGASWTKRGTHTTSGNYYVELVPDPADVDRVYSLDTFAQVSDDGGESFHWAGEDDKHVDNHSLWIDPADTDHLIAGCDGGLYESWDRARTWDFKANLPITQFYKLALDNAEPFYNVYGGTQDNFTLGGPSRTTHDHGISNDEWFVAQSGDGFQPRVDPEDPNTVYAQAQYGNLARFDKRTGESVDIQPQPEAGEEPARWNWDAPLIISPHSNTRLYFGSQKLFRSDDRGDSWRAVSGDLTRQIDGNQLEVMGEIWNADAVNKNQSTTPYGNLVSLSESPLLENLLYAGSDDGLIHASDDGGASWRQIEEFPGVPAHTYVNDIEASRHGQNTVYAAFNNHKSGDFAPYLLKSTDRGQSWTSVAGDLPERGSVYAVIEDPVKSDLLFVGTEFGVFFTIDGGSHWIQLRGGVPTIAVRDLAIQERAADLVLGTFGRGFYILDDYTVLRHVSEEVLERDATLFPLRSAGIFVPSFPLGVPGKSFQGASFYAADNPPIGAVFTYHLSEPLKTLEEERHEREEKARKEKAVSPYPSWDELRAEEREEDPAIVLSVTDAEGRVVRRVTGPSGAGFHRVAWDLRYPAPHPVELAPSGPTLPWATPDKGRLAAPGRYTVRLSKRVRGESTALSEAQSFEIQPLTAERLPEADRATLVTFQAESGRLYRAVLGAVSVTGEAQGRIDHLKLALRDAPAAEPHWRDELDGIEAHLRELEIELTGDATRAGRNAPTEPSILGRIGRIVDSHWGTTTAPTQTQRRGYEIAASQFESLLPRLTTLIETDLVGLEERAESAEAPWTPGRLPRWGR